MLNPSASQEYLDTRAMDVITTGLPTRLSGVRPN
jgi:hypothetical protein